MSLPENELKKKIDEFIIGMMKNRAVPGMSLGIIKDGKTFYQRGYGYRNIAEGLPMTPDTLYGIGSSSKSFVALAMMQLVEQGKIDLEAPVSDYINFKLGLEGHPIKIKHILSHTSGVQDLTFGTLPFFWAEGNYQWVMPMSNPEDYLTVLNSAQPFVRFPPGEHFMYNNDFYEVAGLVIESQIDGSYEEYITENIMKPLGMERTTYKKSHFLNDPMKNIMTGYGINMDIKKVTEKPFPFGKTINAAGAILSSANEMLNYLQMLLNKGTFNGTKILGEEFVDKMWTGMIKNPYSTSDDSEYCFGWMRENDFLGTTLIRHGGNVAAASNAMEILPEKNIAVILGQNMDNELTQQMALGVLAILLEKDPMEVLPQQTIIQKIGPIMGQYSDHAGTSAVTVGFEGPSLMLTVNVGAFPEQKYAIIPVNLEKLIFKIASPLPVPIEIQFFIDEKTKEIYIKFDRNIFFKK